MRTVCELLALGGWRVQVLGSTATEGDLRLDAQEWLRSCRIEHEIEAGPQSTRIFRFEDRGVDYVLLDVGKINAADAEQRPGDAFDALFDQLLANIQPAIFLTYGGWLAELERRCKARKFGSRVIFSIRNEAYICPPAFANIDAAFCSSRFLAERVRAALGVPVTVLPLPVYGGDVIALERAPTFVTFINPEPIKGAAVFARIAEEISCRRPEIPVLVVKSRCGADVLLAMALAGGFDLRRHPNIGIAEPVSDPARIFAVTRVLLVPSLVESAGRVAAEALLNGIPVVASDCGGLPETIRGGGFVLPLPPEVTPETVVPPPPQAVQPWVDLTIRLMTDHLFHEHAVSRAQYAGRAYDQQTLVSVYCNYFEQILRSPRL